MTDDASYFERLAAGAEYLAATTADSGEQIEHLKMAGSYHRQAQIAGSRSRPAVLH